MKTFVLYTIGCQKITVRNCKNLKDALRKTGLKEEVVFKVEEI